MCMLRNPGLARELMDKMTEGTMEYLRLQIKAGVQAIQIFDTWGGILFPARIKAHSDSLTPPLINGLTGLGDAGIYFSGRRVAHRTRRSRPCRPT